MDRRDELLDALTDHVEEHGLEGSSVRALAEAAGVAHNTLTHHFGSRSELVAAIFQRLAQRISAASTASPTIHDASFRERLTDVWASLRSPSYEPLWATFFEMLGQALRDPQQHRAFLAHVTDDWTKPLSDELTAQGQSPQVAAASATFVVATTRGLIIDAMCGGESPRIRDAFEMLAELVATATHTAPSQSR